MSSSRGRVGETPLGLGAFRTCDGLLRHSPAAHRSPRTVGGTSSRASRHAAMAPRPSPGGAARFVAKAPGACTRVAFECIARRTRGSPDSEQTRWTWHARFTHGHDEPATNTRRPRGDVACAFVKCMGYVRYRTRIRRRRRGVRAACVSSRTHGRAVVHAYTRGTESVLAPTVPTRAFAPNVDAATRASTVPSGRSEVDRRRASAVRASTGTRAARPRQPPHTLPSS